MRHLLIRTAFCLTAYSSFGQVPAGKEIDRAISSPVALAPLRFLASDELMGRSATRPEIHIAARYISEQFRSFGLKEIEGTNDYFQRFALPFVRPTSNGELSINNLSYKMGVDLLVSRMTDRKGVSFNGPMVYIGAGLLSDIDKADLKGKVVVMDLKTSDTSKYPQAYYTINERSKTAVGKGAVAVIVRYEPVEGASWSDFQYYFTQEYIIQEKEAALPVYFLNDPNKGVPASITQNAQGKFEVGTSDISVTPAKNVMGWVEGTDPKLKNQFIVLSSHYDHLGVAAKPKTEQGKLDSIYNGARDNAIGTTAVIDAARYFAVHPPKRSVLFVAFTAEELGLVGSKYFAEHPALPLKQLVYNLNIDNASYNDTTIVTFVGLGRTSADADIKKACAAYGLSVSPDPTAEQWLFNGSDNLPLAEKGIPAPTFSLGMRTFDSTIFNRYHQLSDEVENFNLNYAVKFIHAYILAAKNLADNPVQPKWKKGDKYEAAWKALYQQGF